MEIERNERHPFNPALREGDFVGVHFNLGVSDGFIGYVISASVERVRLKAHQRLKAEFDRDTCLDWDLVIPMTAVAFVRHLKAKPLECSCKDGL